MRPNRRSIAVVGLALVTAWTAFAQTPAGRTAAPPPPRTAPRRPALPPAVVTVGPRRIGRAEFDRRTEQVLAEYEARTRTKVPVELKPMFRRQMLENMIRGELLILEARRRGISVSAQEAEAELKRDPFFQQNGAFSEAKYLAVKTTNAEAFNNAVEDMRGRLAARRLSEKLEAQYTPEQAGLQAAAVRVLTHATLDLLALRRVDFNGSYPEPRESEILDFYRTHAEEFRRPDRAVLSAVFVNQPPLPESLAAVPAERRAWDERMHQRADSLLAAARGGSSLEALALPFGGLKRNLVMTRDNFPRYWRGDATVNAALFVTKPGLLLDQPVPAEPGFLVVRVDEVTPTHVAALREAAHEIRGRLRTESRLHHEDRELAALYATVRDSLRGPGFRLRYAVADTSAFSPGEPTPAEIDHYYRGHLADYSSFDAAAGTVSARPLAEVRDDVRSRWQRDRRFELARSFAERLTDAWSRGRRDAALERGPVPIREVGPLPLGAAVDTGLAGKILGDSLLHRGGARGASMAAFARGAIAFQVFDQVRDYLPTLEQARPRLAAMRAARLAEEEAAGARALFDANPLDFGSGNRMHFSRVAFVPQDILTVPLERGEVEKYYREHLDSYSAPELVRASHILVTPTGPGAAEDAAARVKAEGILRRVRAGEDFAKLAREFSDDPATKEQGGDVGTFGHGTMLDAFERAAFAMRPGDVSEPVKTEVGYHIIKCTEHVAAVVKPLVQIYANVSSDAALAKADTIAAHRADSLYHVIRTAADGRAAAQRLDLQVLPYEFSVDDPPSGKDLRSYFATLARLKPGEVYPGVQYVKALGSTITWVDSISPPSVPTWEKAKFRAIDRYRREAGQRAVVAKRVELDSLFAAGWSFDSVGTLWGGLERLNEVALGTGLPGLGGPEVVDSLVFGGQRDPVLQPGGISPWLALPQGQARIRLVERLEPGREQVAQRVENERRIGLERNLQAYYAELEQRFPVRILDRELRETPLPPLPKP